MSSQMKKISEAQTRLLQAMQQGVTLHSDIVEGNVAPLWPTRSAWTQGYRRYSSTGMKSIHLATLDALLHLGLIEEEKRYKSATSREGMYQWNTWTINYRLTEKGRTQANQE